MPWLLFLLAADVFSEASAALSRGDFLEAERGFAQVIRGNPRHLPALGNLGVVYSKTGRFDDAVRVYSRALKLAPANPSLLLNLGLAYFKQERFSEAIPYFEKVSTPQAAELLGASQLYAGRPAEAIATLERMNSREAGVLYLLGVAYARVGNVAASQSHLDEMLTRAASPAQAHFLLGRALAGREQFEEAAREFEAAGAIEGADRELGKSLVALRRNDAAEAALRRALAADSLDTEARYVLGGLLVVENRPAEAIALLAQARRERPRFWGAAYYLGRARLASNDPAGAVASLVEASRLNPDEPAIWFQLARAYRQAGRAADASRAAAKVTALKAKALDDESIILRKK